MLARLTSVVLLVTVLSPTVRARADEEAVWKAFQGTIVVGKTAVEISDYASPGLAIIGLRRWRRSAIEGADGFWRMHLIAFLRQPPEAGVVDIALYDVSNPGERWRLFTSPTIVDPTRRTLVLSNFVLSPDLRCAAGRRYEIVISRLVAGRQDVHARGFVALR